MNKTIDGQSAGGDHFDDIEALLHRYPDLEANELAELKQWFAKDASAFEAASMASKDSLSEAYSAFRAAHLDRLGGRDLLLVLIVGLLLLGLLGLALLG